MTVRGYFSKLRGAREQKRLGITALEYYITWRVLGHLTVVCYTMPPHRFDRKNTTSESGIKETGFEAVQIKLHVCICLPSGCMKLQVQLSVLKEEKRQMLLQLRLEEAERNKRYVYIDSSAGDISGKMR